MPQQVKIPLEPGKVLRLEISSYVPAAPGGATPGTKVPVPEHPNAASLSFAAGSGQVTMTASVVPDPG